MSFLQPVLEPSVIAGIIATFLLIAVPAVCAILWQRRRVRSLRRELIRAGIELGAHVRVGIGDNPDAFPDVTNAELVRWAAQEIRKAGLEPATPQDVRQSFRRLRV